MKKTFLVVAAGLLFAGNLSPAIGQRVATKFDQFGDIYCNDEKARLDNFVNLLRDAPEAKGYIIFYGGRWDHYPYPHRARRRFPRRGEGEARAARLKPYILNGWPTFKPERIVVINGGYRETWEAELWIVPQGADPPTPTPTVKPEELRFRRGRIRKRDYHCYV